MIEPRRTRQREAMSAVLSELVGFASAQEIHEALHNRGESVGLSTVYRNLQALAEAREVDALRNDEGETLYRRCEAVHHHHHLICRSCGRAVEVEGTTVEAWADEVAGVHGFTDIDHTVEIFGTCSACAAS